MKLAIVGMGRVGLVTATALADFGHHVWGIEIDHERLTSLRQAQVPFYEPQLEELVRKNLRLGRLQFTDSTADGVRETPVVFLAVGTEEVAEGAPDLSALFQTSEAVVRARTSYTVLVIKSTVPPGTAAKVRERVRDVARCEYDVISNPEFLREGTAIENFMRPDRVVLGGNSQRGLEIMREIYRPLNLIDTPIVVGTNETAELIKYATNSFLAAKITFINELATLCDAVGADVQVLAKAVGLDKRIGPKFLHPGPGYGGSCLPKDVRTLVKIAEQSGCSTPMIGAVVQSNDSICTLLVDRLEQKLGGLRGRALCALGLAYKTFTDDVRFSPAIKFVREALERGAVVRAHDPMAMEQAAKELSHTSFSLHDSPFDAAKGTDAIVVLTEWNDFRSLELGEMRAQMRGNLLFDTRNVYTPTDAARHGFAYIGRGRGMMSSAVASR